MENATLIEPDPVIEAFKKQVDRALIRANLDRTVEERFERLVAMLPQGHPCPEAVRTPS